MPEHTPSPTPSRSVYGFVLYLTCVSMFILYLCWALIPDQVLYSIGITYFPQKYWAVALPVYFMMTFSLFAFLVYPALNLSLTPSIDSVNTITDKYALAVNLNKSTGIPPVSDIHISEVCRELYLNKNN